jgi:hypothetical protein
MLMSVKKSGKDAKNNLFPQSHSILNHTHTFSRTHTSSNYHRLSNTGSQFDNTPSVIRKLTANKKPRFT